jgi:type I restriction enzyme M protein
MGRPKSSSGKKNGNGAALGFEEKLWASADKMRGHMDAAEYKHVVLGLIFLKYISDAFQERFDKLRDEPHADPEDRDEYTAENVFWVPQEARWKTIQDAAKQSDIGKRVDLAMEAIERENPKLKGVLPKDYGRPSLDQTRLGELVDLVGTIELIARDDAGLFGPKEHRSKDILGRVYEYFLGKFAAAEGKLGGEFFTPQAVVKVLVEMIEPYKGRVYDPCCGTGGMFVQSEKFVEAHGGKRSDLSIFGQESNPTTWKLAKMNLAIRGIEANLGVIHADSFHADQHKDLRADFILANPPFNVSDWGGQRLREDARWKYGTPPVGNANYAWVQQIVHHLAPGGVAGFVLANGSMSSNQSGEGAIRRALVEADLVDCMIALPGQLFYTTQIPACLWFLTRSKSGGSLRDRRGETLFIDARKLGHLVDRTRRDLTDDEVARIARAYHAWRGEPDAGTYADVAGFCKVVTHEQIAAHGFVLSPGRYVGAEDIEDDGEPFEERLGRLVAKLEEQFAESAQLKEAIRYSLGRVVPGAKQQ